MRMTMTVVLIAALGVAHSARAQTSLPFQGYLERDGTPVSGQVEMDFAYFNQATDGTACSSESSVLVDVFAGTFSVLLVPADACLDGDLFLEVALYDEGGIPVPFGTRQRIQSAATAYAASPERAFSAPQGIVFGASGAAIEPSATSLLVFGPEGGDIVAEVLADSPQDAFDVRIAAAPGAAGVVPGSALTVSADGHTAARTLSATSINVDAATANTVTTDVLNADEINGDLATVNGATGCIRLGSIQQCWGRYVSSTDGNYRTATFELPFSGTNYSITCAPNGGAVADRRFCQTRGCTPTGCGIRTATANGFSGIGGHYIAIGPFE